MQRHCGERDTASVAHIVVFFFSTPSRVDMRTGGKGALTSIESLGLARGFRTTGTSRRSGERGRVVQRGTLGEQHPARVGLVCHVIAMFVTVHSPGKGRRVNVSESAKQ